MAVFAKDAATMLPLYHHIFFPPKLPQQEEELPSELYLAQATHDALVAWQQALTCHSKPIDRVTRMMKQAIKTHSRPHDFIDENQLHKSLAALDTGDTIVLNIKVQNAAVLVTRRDGDFIFETFELSARNVDVMTTRGRLIRTFPGRAVNVASSTLQQSDFLPELARTLAIMSQQVVPEMQPQSVKAKASHVQVRDTTRPSIVTELLFGVLRSLGKPISVRSIEKKTRDEINWNKALKPWRRSPMWLMIRVALQLGIERSSDGEGSRNLYKKFMLFLTSHLLKHACAIEFSVEGLRVMAAKVNRKLTKLLKVNPNLDDGDLIICLAYEALETSNQYISTQWQAVQDRDIRTMKLSSLLSVTSDCWVHLPDLDLHVDKIRNPQAGASRTNFKPSSKLVRFESSRVPPLDLDRGFVDDPEYAAANLQAFENWVSGGLKEWAKHTRDADVCKTMYDLIPLYHRLSLRIYSRNPEAVSIMVLTIFEMWVVCDAAATATHPLICDYDPDIWQEVLQSLLLSSREHMERLEKIEKYLNDRKKRSRHPSHLIFSINNASGLPYRFYEASEHHQILHQKIQAKASRDREDKWAELERLKDNYRYLDALVSSTSHNMKTVKVDDWTNETEERHTKPCQACNFQRQRDALNIHVFEEPLPDSPIEAKSIVFELSLPSTFAYWRDTRSFLLQQVLKGRLEKVQLQWHCSLSESDPHLTARYLERNGPRRIDLWSSVKSTVESHYESESAANANRQSVCVSNGMRYQYYDVDAHAVLGSHRFSNEITLECTHQDVNSSLKMYLQRTANAPDGRPPNEVIANQHTCPSDMTMEEFKSLAIIPCGLQIQWTNIATELHMPGVDFRKVDTAFFFYQCIHQTGPPSGTMLREAHAVLAENKFASLLINCLGEALDRIDQNWGLIQALGLFSAIAVRVLSMNESVVSESLTFLDKARQVATVWTRSLSEKARAAVLNDDRTYLVGKSVESALVCLSTFDLNEARIGDLLKSPDRASLMVEMSITVQEGRHALAANNTAARLMSLRVKRILHRSYKILSQKHSGITAGIKKSWLGFPSTVSTWIRALDHTDEWVTPGCANQRDAVHYNLLTGELLVNGDPLNQPPRSYREHALFRKLFGNLVFEVMPSAEPGFQYSAKRSFSGFDILLGMSDGELTVRASKDQVDWEVIPGRLLHEEYPTYYSSEHIHWCNTATGEVQLQHVQNSWPSETDDCWTLRKCPIVKQWCMQNKAIRLVGSRSRAANAISNLMQPLADISSVHIKLDTSTSDINVDLHAAKLRFLARQGCEQLRSKDYPGMVISESQFFGSLIGLRNKLLLESESGDKLVLIPESSVSFERDSKHVVVHIGKTDIRKVHAFTVDPLLGRLVSRHDPDCKIYLAYLHALTSFCLPDPLLQCTGNEQALTILHSKSLVSYTKISEESISTLEQIASLSPGRQYYPLHLKCMQTTTWDSRLSLLSQDDNYVPAVADVLRVMRLHISPFQQPSQTISSSYDQRSNEELRDRGRLRSSFLRLSEYGAEDHDDKYDCTYKPRDDEWSVQASNSFAIASMLSRPENGRHLGTCAHGYLWNVFRTRGIQEVHGARDLARADTIGYDAAHLEPQNFDLVLQNFPAVHAWLTNPQSVAGRKLAVVMWLASLGFALKADMQTLQILVSLARGVPTLTQIASPEVRTFYVSKGKDCIMSTLRTIENRYRRPFHACPEVGLARGPNEKKNHYYDRRQRAWTQAQNSFTTKFLNSLVSQWPCRNPQRPHVETGFEYSDTSEVMPEIQQCFKHWHDNLEFSQYLGEIETVVTGLTQSEVGTADFIKSTPSSNLSVSGYFRRSDLFARDPVVLPEAPNPLKIGASALQKDEEGTFRLGPVIRGLRDSSTLSLYEERWISELEASWEALKNSSSSTKPLINADNREQIERYLVACQDHAKRVDESLVHSTELTRHSRISACSSFRQRTRPILFLQQLTRRKWGKLSLPWKKALVVYGLALSNLQRAQRLVKYLESEDDLVNELRNEGHTSWDPMQFPEWLVLEVESGLTIRSVQYQVASQMLDPDTGENTVMQLNMGEGKSTVIIPMAATAIADGFRLARVIVNRPQSKQMLHMLVAKLGGIIDRQVYHLPFVRSPRLELPSATMAKQILEECMQTGGVLLAQPEHILSLRHMAPEHYILQNHRLGQTLLDIQEFLDDNCRDIIDESDENFSVRLELIYTMGTEQVIEAHPDRWRLQQEVLAIIQDLAPGVCEMYPSHVELVIGNPGEFHRLRITKTEACSALTERVAEYISENGVSGLQISRQSVEIRKAFQHYICDPQITKAEAGRFEETSFWTAQTAPLILLLRGLIAGGILRFIFGQKRWRVNFGLAERVPPTSLAVPYRAKDCPALRSEFSHPDVVIALTLLSYYYNGLSEADLWFAFGHMTESDQADAEYQLWVKDAYNIPNAFRQLQGVNLQDRPQCVSQLFPAFRLAKATIDYFLAQIVFPRQMKEFATKLSASGWDIGKKKRHLATGFSGTKDSRSTLPLDVTYLDLPEQRHTNALVLEHLLKDGNSVIIIPRSVPGQSDAENILSLVLRFERPVQVILDVGAQILELDNLAMAKRWLEKDNQCKQAVVFVDGEDNLCVVDRDGQTELLHTSSYSSSLGSCLVFLDQSHTRGIDLKLPKNYRAAVMLGPRLVKDSLVQACMRMRQLGRGQTLEFCVPKDVETALAETVHYSSKVKVSDIVQLSIMEAFAELRRSMPLWAVQGERFLQQRATWRAGLTPENAHLLLENERQSIQDRYQPHRQGARPCSSTSGDLARIRERCEEFGGLDMGSSVLQEEQERELAPEKEQEREIQHAPPMEPAAHPLRPDVWEFVQKGVLKQDSKAYMRAFQSLKDIAIEISIPVEQLCVSPNFWVTRDFATTVLPMKRDDSTSQLFLRPVRWLLTASDNEGKIKTVMVISPFEANQLTSRIEGCPTAMHVYAPRNNMGYDPMDKLDFRHIPASRVAPSISHDLAAKLNVFAGQVYFSSWDQYVACGKAFSISTQTITEQMERDGYRIDPNGFIISSGQSHSDSVPKLTQSPIQFLKRIALIRNGGRSIERTHMGQFLAGNLLSQRKIKGNSTL